MDAFCVLFSCLRKNMRQISVKKLALWAVMAALYAAITLLTASFAFGPVQFRLADAMCVLCCFAPHMTAGVTLGCFLANLFSSVSALDMVVGTAATLVACLWMTRCRRAVCMVLPNVLANGILVGAMLAWVYTPGAFWQGFLLNGLQVAAGELAVMVVLGVPLFVYIRRSTRLLRQLRGEDT